MAKTPNLGIDTSFLGGGETVHQQIRDGFNKVDAFASPSGIAQGGGALVGSPQINQCLRVIAIGDSRQAHAVYVSGGGTFVAWAPYGWLTAFRQIALGKISLTQSSVYAVSGTTTADIIQTTYDSSGNSINPPGGATSGAYALAGTGKTQLQAALTSSADNSHLND